MAARNGASGARSTSGPTGWRRIRKGSSGPFPRRRLKIRAAAFTTREVGRAPILPEVPDRIPPEQEIASVTADGACDTRKCHGAIAVRGAAAIIPPRKTARPWKPGTAGAAARNEILRTSQPVGRTLWRRWSGSHRRSRAETRMPCARLLGQRLPRGTSTARLQRSRSASPAATGSPPPTHPPQRSHVA